MKKQKIIRLVLSIATCLFVVTGITLPAVAEKETEKIRTIIEKEYPGAEIEEIEEEIWQGKPVTEVEITTKEGVKYEICFSKDGEILKVEEEDELPWIGGELMIGLAAIGKQEIYKGVGSEFGAAPFLRYINGPFELQTYDRINAIYQFYRTDNFSVAVNGSFFTGEGYEADDSDYLDGMDELNTLHYVGLEVESRFNGWEFGFDITQDISGEHKGQEAEISISYQWIAAGFEFSPSIGMTWLSKKTVDYYYGVSSTEATAGRPFYAPGASYELSADLMVQRPIFGNFTAVGIVGISTFGNEITDSPLVEENYEISGILGVMYTF